MGLSSKRPFKWDFYNFLKQDNWSRLGRRREPAGGTQFPGKETCREGNSRRQEATPELGRESLMISSPGSAEANGWTARHVTCVTTIWKRNGPSQSIKCFLQRAELLLIQWEVMWQICSTIPNYSEPKMYRFRQEQHHSQPAALKWFPQTYCRTEHCGSTREACHMTFGPVAHHNL